jgi:hypothetical protein
MERYAGGVVLVREGQACVREAGVGLVGVPVVFATHPRYARRRSGCVHRVPVVLTSIRTVARRRRWRGAVSASRPASDTARFGAHVLHAFLRKRPAPAL